MPSGRTHDRATIIFSPIIIGGVLFSNLDIQNSIVLITLYFFSSFMFNGDLDIISRPYNRWSVLKFIWKPYQKLFEHRSIWTHGVIIGTIVRILYLLILLSPLIYFTNFNIIAEMDLTTLLIIFFGLESGSALHTLLDYTM
jgi:uncharacterized metal-binding protein